MDLLSAAYSDDAYEKLLRKEHRPWILVVGEGADIGSVVRRAAVKYGFALGEWQRVKWRSDAAAGSANLLSTSWYTEVMCCKHNLVLIVLTMAAAVEQLPEQLDRAVQSLSTLQHRTHNMLFVLLVQCDTVAAASTVDVDALTMQARAAFGSRFHGVLLLSTSEADSERAGTVWKQVRRLAMTASRAHLAELRSQAESFTTTREVLLRQAEAAYVALVVHDYATAAQYFCRACSSVLALFPHHAPLQARLCASLLLHHALEASVFSTHPIASEVGESGNRSVSDEQLVSGLLSWLGESYTSSFLPACRTLVALITRVECGMWLRRLAATTSDRTLRADCLLRALSCFTQAEEVAAGEVRESTDSSVSFEAPAFVGGEAGDERYADIMRMPVIRDKCKLYLQSVTSDVEADAQLSSSAAFLYEKVEQRGKGMSADSLQTLLAATLCKPGCVWGSSAAMLRAIGQLCCTKGTTDESGGMSDDCWRYLVHQCVSPGSVARQRRWLRRFVVAAKDNARGLPELHYPSGGFVAPISIVLALPQQRPYITCSTESTIVVTLHTTSSFPIRVHMLQLTFGAVVQDGEVAERVVVALSKEECVVDFAHSCQVRCSTIFDKTGSYRCIAACASISMQGVRCSVAMTYSATPHPSRCVTRNLSTTLQVRASISSFSVQCPATICGVEGDVLTWHVHLTSACGSLTQGHLSLPCRSYVQHVKSDQCSAVCEQEQYTLVLPSISPGTTVAVTLQCSFVASGVFHLPMRFAYHSLQHGEVCVTKVLQVLIQLPFSVTFRTYLHTRHSCGNSSWPVPLPATVCTQVQYNKLSEQQHGLGVPVDSGHPSIACSAPTSGSTHDGRVVEAEAMGQYYYVVRDAEAAATAPPCVPRGEPILILTQLVCSARCGVRLHHASLLCVEGVERLYVSEGVIDCELDEGHEFTIAARLCVNVAGLVAPGFMRVVFSSSAGRKLYADICLPRLQVQPRDSQSVDIRYTYPATVLLGHAFDLCLHVQNMLDMPFSGECIVDSTAPSFVLQGLTRTSFAVAPHDVHTICVTLTASKLGRCGLPSIMIRDPHHSRIITSSTGVQYVTVLAPS